MEDLMKKLSEASEKLKEAVIKKADNMDEKMMENIALIKRVKLEVSILAQIICGKVGNCNAKIACDIKDGVDRTFEILQYGEEEVLVHCPEWYNDGKFGWKYLNEISLSEAKEIAECLIEVSQKEDELRIELI